MTEITVVSPHGEVLIDYRGNVLEHSLSPAFGSPPARFDVAEYVKRAGKLNERIPISAILYVNEAGQTIWAGPSQVPSRPEPAKPPASVPRPAPRKPSPAARLVALAAEHRDCQQDTSSEYSLETADDVDLATMLLLCGVLDSETFYELVADFRRHVNSTGLEWLIAVSFAVSSAMFEANTRCGQVTTLEAVQSLILESIAALRSVVKYEMFKVAFVGSDKAGLTALTGSLARLERVLPVLSGR